MRRAALTVFFASVAVNAAFGLYAVLTPTWDQTQGKILGTSLCVTGAVLVALACEPAWERSLLGPVPLAGAALGLAAFAAVIGAIWFEPTAEIYGRIVGSTFTAAIACTMASLLALARLAPRRAWVFRATLALLTAAAVLVGLLWWWDDPGEIYLRAMGLVLIVLAAFVASVPVLHWIDRGALAVADVVPGAIRFCPFCGREARGELQTTISCGRCGREFVVSPISDPDTRSSPA